MRIEEEACKECESSKKRQHYGVYRLQCVECCARLVLSTHPNEPQASVMLAVIDRVPGNPGRARVLESVRRGLEKRHSATTR